MAQTGNVLFLYRNYCDPDVQPGSAASASSHVTGAEASMTQYMDPGEPWRATGKTSESLTYDFGAEVDITHAAAVFHNLNVQGTIRFQLSNVSNFAALIYDSGDQEAWDPVAGLGGDAFGFSLGGYPRLTKFNDFRPLKLFPLGAMYSARYARFIFKNPTNADITGVALGRGFVGLGLQPKRNFAWDWDNEWVDESQHRSTNRSLRIKRGQKYRVLRLTLPWLDQLEAIGAWDDIKRSIGNSRDIIVVAFPDAGAPKRYRTTIFGVPIDRMGTRNPYFDVYASAMHVREMAA